VTSDIDRASELADARRRLETVEVERLQAESLQTALYRIAELASAAQDMQEFYRSVHAVVGELMFAKNFYIALYDDERQLISWPYYVDEIDPDIPDPNKWDAFGEGEGRGTTAYVLRTGEAQLLDYERHRELVEHGEVELLGVLTEDTTWVGVPLKAEGRTVGVLVVQSYTKDVRYSEQDKELLAFVGQHIGAALSRARAIEETRQRNAELALLNSVQAAIAGELDAQAIYDLVGDKIREVFDAQVVDIGIYDEASGLMHFPYTIERGIRYPDEPIELIGFRKHVMETREPLMVNEDVPAVSTRYGNPGVLTGEPSKSLLFAPLVAGGNATGVISLQNVDREHAFTDADQRLLTTLAGSLSVALENARLVHETRQRNAELALINSVQAALAGELQLQAIYDVVGDKIQEIFDAQVVDIGVFDFDGGITRYPYTIERGVRFPDEPVPMMASPTTRMLLETKAPVLINDVPAWDRERGESSPVNQGEPALSVLVAPLVLGEELRGRISLQNLDRKNAFSENDVRLLTTLAGSLSVALENARLMHETRQRNAELALINSVQAAVAGELDPQAIYDLVGDRVQEVFDAQVVSISIYDEAAGQLSFPYVIERGERLHQDPIPLIGFRKHVLETREPLMINEDVDAAAERYGNPRVLSGDPPKSILFVPLVAGGKANGVVSLQNVDREHAFTESDLSLLTTLSGSLSVALDNARLVDETRQRVAELATVNSVGQALATQLELDALIELVGERVRETFEADLAYVALHDEQVGQIEFAYYYEAGERRQEPPLEYGQGLTSQILDSREPLLLNRVEHYEGLAMVGTPSRSYLGVPIMVGEKAIGVISVQSTGEEGRFGEGDMRLLATIAANVGVAIQTARLFAEIGRQKEYLESLVEITPVAVIVMDPKERVTGWNPAATELFGHTAEEAIGRQIDDLVFGDEVRDEGREVTRDSLASGRAQRITRRRRKDGTPIDVELMLVPLTVEDEHVGFLGIYHDITELQLAREEAEAATQAKSAFLATMSHEIRTPMNAVIGMTGLLLSTELTDEQREFAEVVRSSGDALLHVIDDILDYSKIEAGKLELEKEPVDLRECVEGALDIVAPRAWEKTIELGCLIAEDAPAGIVGDAGRLRQVLLNLLSNAVKFTEEGEVVVLLDAERTGRRSYRLEFAVRDTGIGIPKDRMDNLFDSFSQVDASTTRRYGGTGLGLAITKRLVELMGGTMWVESEEGKGSTFRIGLPTKAAEVSPKTELDVLPKLAGKRILVVDDNATNCEIVARHARSWGMDPVAVEGPSEALALIEEGEKFDVAVLDMMMPEMDGLALAQEIRRRRDERELPLVLLTSLGRLPQGESSGAFAVQLAKPVKASQLYNALLKALAEHAHEPEAGEAVTGAAEPTRSTMRILVAEDNVVNQKVALRLLDRLGYRADVVFNGLQALDALERQRYDVVLMDVQMPELDGLDASRRIHERWTDEARPRIIAMTANALPEDREACFAAGMDDYLSKPIRPDELAAALSRVRLREETNDSDGNAGVSLEAGAVQGLKELGGEEFLAEVIDTFVADAPALIATLRASHERGDAEELRRTAHSLKSNGQTFGAERFAEFCRELEERAKRGELDGASELINRIDREYGALEGALVALRPQPAS
jgi:PAS domain S-box-containing protein